MDESNQILINLPKIKTNSKYIFEDDLLEQFKISFYAINKFSRSVPCFLIETKKIPTYYRRYSL